MLNKFHGLVMVSGWAEGTSVLTSSAADGGDESSAEFASRISRCIKPLTGGSGGGECNFFSSSINDDFIDLPSFAVFGIGCFSSLSGSSESDSESAKLARYSFVQSLYVREYNQPSFRVKRVSQEQETTHRLYAVRTQYLLLARATSLGR